MFHKDCTSSIIGFINSVIRLGKIEDYRELLDDAILELRSRVPLIATCYDCDERLQ